MVARPRLAFRLAVNAACLGAVSTVVFAGVSAWGQDPLREAEQTLSTTRHDLKQQLGHLDWEQQKENIERALETVWADNAWTNESDRFALEVARDTSAIPPWQPMKRIDLMVERYGQRYHITDEDTARLKRKIVIEAGSFLARNAATLFKQTQASLDLSDGAASMSPKQVADMVQEIEPIRADALAMIDRLIVEVETLAPESAKETILRDIRSFRKRETHIDRMVERWKRGEWQPRDWGLTDGTNPLRPSNGERIGGVAGSNRQGRNGESGADAPARSNITICVPHKPSTWFVHVRDFQKRFKLDAAQGTAARSIESELVSRASAYRDSHKKELAKVPPGDRPTHVAFAPIVAMFGDLQERLDAVLTSSQRDIENR